jgi:signal peptidase I
VTVAPIANSSSHPRLSSAVRDFLRTSTALIVPAVLSLLMLRFLFPSRLEGAERGAAGGFAWVADQHPLLVVVVLFMAITETGRYWFGRLTASNRASAVSSSPSVFIRSLPRFLSAVAVVALLAFFSRSSIVSTSRVVGPSMLPTLEIGDRVLVDRLAYGIKPPFAGKLLNRKTPRRGDLVVFRANGLTGAEGPQSIVKRVIGLPGDQVKVDRGTVLINNWSVPSCDAGPYVAMTGRLTVRGRLVVEYLGEAAYLTVRKPVEKAFPGYGVKPGEIFVLGDDRGLSSDSRTWSEGGGTGVPIQELEGRVTRVLFGARPDGRLDLSRILSAPLDLHVRMPGIDMNKTDERIGNCLKRRPTLTTPPDPRPAS